MDAAGSGAGDAQFVGSIPDLYERLMVPMLFAEPAAHLADAVLALSPDDVLETAAGTGVLTRALRSRLPGAAITATDLNPPMVAAAQARGGADGVIWEQADASDLPYDDAGFDVVACQFGVMFFGDKPRAFGEARRVLRPGGAFVFNTWDSTATNQVADAITEALIAAAPEEPLLFMRRTPHGYHDETEIRGHLASAGFTDVTVRLMGTDSRTTAAHAARAFCQATPLRGEIERHPVLDLETATELSERALRERWGDGEIVEPITWFQIVASG